MNTDTARVQMVSQQVRTWEVLDPRVLEAMNVVSREHFVPHEYRNVAFADSRIPLAHGQVMLAPKVVGRIAQGITLHPSDRVLEIGTGSGYLTACLAHLANQVTSIDVHAELTASATDSLAQIGCTNIGLHTADAFAYSSSERFNAIAITGSLPNYDTRFEKLLKVGGRLFAIVGKSPVMDARIITRISEDQWVANSLFETDVPALVNAPDPAGFKF